MEIPTRLRMRILQALADQYEEGAIESVWEVYPDFTRDEAVDVVEQVAREAKA